MRLLEKNTHRQILGYLFVSGLNFGLTFSVFTVSLKLLGIAYPIALLLAFVMGNMFTYVLNYLFVFKAGEKFAYSPFLKYIFANSFTFGVNLVGLIFIVETFNTDPFWTQVVLILPIILVNFLTAKLWSLRQAAS